MDPHSNVPQDQHVPVADMELDTPPARPPHFAQKAVKRKKKIMLIVTVSVAVLLVIGAGAYWFLKVRKDAPAPQAQTQQTANTTDDQPVVADATTTSYKSSKLNIEFTHRKDWKVQESADRSEVTVTSPKTTYTKADGTSTEGVFTLKMRTGTIPEAIQSTVTKAIAVRDSEVVAYDAPTEQQRQYTNITDAGSDANTFNFVIVSSSTAFKAGQVLGYGVNLTGDAYLFAGGYGKDAGNTLTFDGLSKTEFQTPTYEQARAVLTSLKIY
ncbi:MAG TPA: hypothetical protein VLF43_01125 [Candidatus Saccharimonadales bacterium]|nr:hypothetical protein [Candidatus Saccharimonadales bacterium]